MKCLYQEARKRIYEFVAMRICTASGRLFIRAASRDRQIDFGYLMIGFSKEYR